MTVTQGRPPSGTRKPAQQPPRGYRHCAYSRLYAITTIDSCRGTLTHHRHLGSEGESHETTSSVFVFVHLGARHSRRGDLQCAGKLWATGIHGRGREYPADSVSDHRLCEISR
jgi:hypothetical protein